MSHRSIHSVCYTDGDDEIGTDDSRMAQDLVTKAGVQDLSIPTVRFFAESTFLHEVNCCHGEG